MAGSILARSWPICPSVPIQGSGTPYQLAANGSTAPTIWIASNDQAGVIRAASDLAADFGRVVGVNGTIKQLSSPSTSDGSLIIAGTIGNSSLIDSLISSGKLNVSSTQGKWESYTATLVEAPFSNVSQAYVIAGSDQRGTIYGMYDISETIGVSPWYWWADVYPTAKVQGPPSVKYRGIFLNDEQPALTDWAALNFLVNDTPFTSRFHAHVFELLLRLKANYFWPAMWAGMFYVEDAQNSTFFQQGVTRSENWETLYIMGMRGNGDAASPTFTSSQLEQIIDVLQGILTSSFPTRSISSIPQTWVLYKEVGGYYQQGMKVPDDITLLWPDDNVGNIMRLPIASETNRSSGAGIYYHFDYVGSPRDYKWINTVQMQKTWEQMHMAYEHSADRIWIVNVGDLKPLEIPISHFLDMAYDMSLHQSSDSTTDFLVRWATAQFSSTVANATAEIMNTYGQILQRRKYELLSDAPFAFSISDYDEVYIVLQEWEDLLALAQDTYNKLDAARSAFFEMVLRPVMAGKTVYDLYINSNLNSWYYGQQRTSANTLANAVVQGFANDSNKMLSQVHLGYTTWSDPYSNIMPPVRYYTSGTTSSGAMGVAIQGSSKRYPGNTAPSLLSADPYMPPTASRYIDIFYRSNASVSCTVASNVLYVTFDSAKGTLESPGTNEDIRNVINVDWASAPSGLSHPSVIISSSSTSASFVLPVNKTSLGTFTGGYVESGGVVSIEAEHYNTVTPVNGLSYITIPYYGRTLSGVKLWPVTAGSQTTSTGPKLTYSFYTFSTTSSANMIVLLGSSLNAITDRPLKYPVPSAVLGTDPNEWTAAVENSGWTVSSRVSLAAAGAHTLNLWALEPGVVFQKIVIDVGGYHATGSMGPPESYKA
ncbi:hypothetical protein F5Y16DRAFT_408953 [Xylariaceae sp. FL0255]|nr:hypothetical protein F5Y16DRAFT_408953 [Xylariaceae sp. FL0255]